MEREFIEQRLLELLKENGFDFQEDESEEEDILLDMDSLQFISFIADIEETFEIVIPDEFLVQSEELFVSDFIDMVEQAVSF